VFGLKNKNKSELTVDEELIFEKNITWLFGNARGGTTWVALQLLSHNTVSINEPHLEEHLAMRGIRGPNAPIVRRIDNPENNPDYFFSQKYRDVWMKFLKKLILNRFFAQVKDIHQKVVIKEPCSVGAIDILTQCMKNSKSIILLRDGRDVLDSWLDAKSKNGFMTKASGQPITDRINGLRNQARLWAHRTEHFLNTYNNLQPNLRYIVKYEDILQDKLNELTKLYKFLGVKISKNEVQNIVTRYDFKNIPKEKKGPGKFYRSASPGLWKEHFSEDEKKLVNEIMATTLEKAGYEI